MVPATKIDESLSTAGQITAEDVAGIAAAGFSVIVNNRPDGEGGPDQPSSAVVGEAARVAGLSYHYLPMTPEGITPDMVTQFRQIRGQAAGPIFAHCRTGARSTILWALTEIAEGRSPEEVVAQAAAAQRDLSNVLPLLQRFAAQG
jgi:sulfide:quinone oxidoreductase|tara:strand:+ start:563 stop:1000 length:438 start_codon:yes stop_codon:yes gene_type:complete